MRISKKFFFVQAQAQSSYRLTSSAIAVTCRTDEYSQTTLERSKTLEMVLSLVKSSLI